MAVGGNRRTAKVAVLLAGTIVLSVLASALGGSGGAAEAQAVPDPSCGTAWPAAPQTLATYDLASGRMCWSSADVTVDFPSPDLGRVEGGVFVSEPFSGASGLSVFDLTTGVVRWRLAPDGTLTTTPGLPPLAGSGLVVRAEPGASVAARDTATGTERWRVGFGSDPAVGDDPILFVVEGADAVYVSAFPRMFGVAPLLVALDRETGTERWRRSTIGAASAVDADADAVVVDGAAGLGFLGVEVVDAATGTTRFGLGPGPLRAPVGGGLLYRSDGFALVAVDLVTGAERWRRASPVWTAAAVRYEHGALLVPSFTFPLAQGATWVLDAATGATRVALPGTWDVSGLDPATLVAVVQGSDGEVPRELRLLDAGTGATTSTVPLDPGPWPRLRHRGFVVGEGRLVLLRTKPGPFGPTTRPGWCETPAPARALDPPAVQPAPGPSAVVPVTPFRLLDSRLAQYGGYLCPGERVTMRVTGEGAIPAEGVSGVVVNVALVGFERPGFAALWPAALGQPLASLLNTPAGEASLLQLDVSLLPWVPVRSNLAIVPVGPDGQVTFFTQSGGYLVIDAVGYLAPTTSATAGRVVTLPPTRALDTRVEATPLMAGESRSVVVAGAGGPAPAGAQAVIATITATDAAGSAHVTAWEAGTPMPPTSNVNVDPQDATVANLAVVPVGADGAISLVASNRLHLVVDVVGYVTGQGAEVSGSGLVVPLAPARAVDTRVLGDRLVAGSPSDRTLSGAAGLPAGARAAFVNLTATGPTAPAYVRAWPSDGDQPATSNLNVGAGETRAAAGLVALGPDGRVQVSTSSGSLDLLVDVMAAITP